MRVRGEAFLLINAWMDFLALWLAACVGRRHFRPMRAAAASVLGAGYALAAWTLGGVWRGLPALAAAGLGMAWIAFGRDAGVASVLTFTGGLMLSGAAAWLTGQGMGAAGVTLLCGAAAAAVCALTRRRAVRGRGRIQLILTAGGKTARMPVLRDSGNLLRFGGGGLPVIAAPEKLIRPLLAPGTDLRDLATLPRGWRLIRVRTAAGVKTAMAFVPDAAALRRGGKTYPVRAAAAVMDMPGRYALAPDSLFRPAEEKEGSHAGL